MTLRSDVTFTDGTKFTADIAAQNLVRFRDGNSPNKSFLAAMADAKAVDDTHLEITLSAADPGFLIYLTQNAGMQESPKAFTAADIKTNPIGSGPYVLDTAATVIGTSYTFTKNPNYWDKPSQHYEKLVYKVYNDPTATLNAIKGKQLNGAKLLNNDTVDQVKAAGYTLTPFELDWTGLLLLDRDGTLNPALKELKVRQAINYAVDANAMLKAVGKGYGTQTTQVFPTSSPAYDAALDTRYAFDPAKAKSLLAEAGFPNGFTIEMPSTAAMGTSIWNLIQQQLKDVGITVNFTDAGTNFISDVLAPKYPATWLQLQQDPDWQLINFLITPQSTFNPFHTTDPKVDELVTALPRRRQRGGRQRCPEGTERLHRRAGLVRALVPDPVQLRDRCEHERGRAGGQRLPLPLELHAEVGLIFSIGVGRVRVRPDRAAAARPFHAHDYSAAIQVRKPINGDVHPAATARRHSPDLRSLVAGVPPAVRRQR